MDYLARLITLLFDGLVIPFGNHRTLSLVVLSIVSGAAFALVFRATSNPDAIKRARSRFQARVLEMRLYPDDAVLLTRAFLGALATQGDYFRAAGKPILILAVVALPVFFQIESRFAVRPLYFDERTLVTATLKPGLDARAVPVSLTATPNAGVVDPRSMRVRATREIVWSVASGGTQELTARAYDVDYRFPVRGGKTLHALGRQRASGPWDALVHAGLPPIPKQSALQSIRVTYPEVSYGVLGLRLNWLEVFLLGSFVGAAIPAWLLRIQM